MVVSVFVRLSGLSRGRGYIQPPDRPETLAHRDVLRPQDELRHAGVLVAVGVEVGAELCQGVDDRFLDGAVGAFDGVGPGAAEAGSFDFHIEFVTVELGGGAIGIEPEIEFQIEIAVVVRPQFGQRLREVDVVADGLVVAGGEAEERKPAIREKPLLGVRGR